ncbi:protein POLR1D isoform X1 [Hydra vulgaris]|uniref:protein POLR1D isoform X1 n=1 Tax=Hydra vulgaris TaxID=6087 RepID=UPI000640D0F7|nr:protein POLR1D [Hydra vulgaris]
MSLTEDELTRLAIAELTRNAQRGRERSATMGSLAWKSCPVPATNKRFLHNTILGAMQANKNISTQSRKRINESKTDTAEKQKKKGKNEIHKLEKKDISIKLKKNDISIKLKKNDISINKIEMESPISSSSVNLPIKKN